MHDYLLLLFGTVFVNNFILVKFLGLCPFMGVSKNISTSIGMSFATTFVLTISTVISYILNKYILVPFEIEYLRIISFIVLIAFVVGITQTIINKTSPLLNRSLGIFLPLITTNCAVLGVALLNVNNTSLVNATISGFGAAVGFSVVLVLFSYIRQRIADADIPATFVGVPIALITVGMMSMAFMGFVGIGQ